MVTDNHYRWDFIQLADDPKPTPATSFKVTDGSTLYTSDDSKLYVWYKDQWYEKSAIGGGGGIPTTVIDTIWFGTQEAYDEIDPKADKTLYLVQEDVETPVTLSLDNRNIQPILQPEINREPLVELVEEIEEPEVKEVVEEIPEEVEEDIPEEAEEVEETPEEVEEIPEEVEEDIPEEAEEVEETPEEVEEIPEEVEEDIPEEAKEVEEDIPEEAEEPEEKE